MLAPPKLNSAPTLGNTYLTAGAIGQPDTKGKKTLLGQ